MASQRSLIGTSLDQVSTNAMLGTLAFQDADGAYIETIRGAVGLEGLSKDITDTAVDVFVYDTSKDSDGGAWRQRTSHTSWYNETLNTATRGSRREFPAVAVIVLTGDTSTSQATIYDGDDPDLPMWMVIPDQSIDWANNNGAPTSTAGLNGKICFTCSGSGITILDFVSDTRFIHYTAQYTFTSRNILSRSSSAYRAGGNENNIVNQLTNDVAMTVLPRAPIDPDTGLQVPTIAVATNGGVSVIKDDGTVVDMTNESGDVYEYTYNIAFTKDYKIRHTMEATSQRYYRTHHIPSSDYAVNQWSPTSDDGITFFTDAGNGDFAMVGGANPITAIEANSFGNSSGLTLFDENVESPTESMVAYATTSYNTGWMHGDCKGAFLSGISTADVSGSSAHYTETFTGSGDNTWGLADNATISGGVLTLANQTSSRATDLTAASSLTTGQKYIAEIEIASNTSGVFNLDDDGAGAGQGSVTVYGSCASGQTGTFLISFTKTGSSRMRLIRTSGGPITITDFKIYTAEEQDRSVNNNGLKVFGTIAKSAVATGAELVAYSGWSSSNYLLQPQNADLDFGTGNFTVMYWFNGAGRSNGYHLYHSTSSNSTPKWETSNQGAGYIRFYDSIANGLNVTGFADNVWNQVAFVRNNGVLYGYLNGEFNASIACSGSLTNTSAELVVGNRHDAADRYSADDLALLRISKSAASAEQIKKIYNDEKVLFQENAKCTLYGSSDAVTALAYDDSTSLLHVGTSSGRSDFMGLKRINHTTTAVSTAISAQDGLIAQQ